MDGFDASTYGDSFADVYDEWYPDVSDAEATATFVSSFGAEQRILELGVGTGRLARAMSGQGHAVVGVDASRKMLERFDGEPAVIAADMADLPLHAERFDTVLVATNTFFNLSTADAQRRCLRECRRVLRLGGRLVLEADVPAEPDPHRDRLVTTRSISLHEVVLTATVRDAAQQTVTGQHIQISADGITMRPWKIRYAEPAELDLMASQAGFRLGDRHDGWSGSPFTPDSIRHVSTYVAI